LAQNYLASAIATLILLLSEIPKLFPDGENKKNGV
jgi:hypothetical protein